MKGIFLKFLALSGFFLPLLCFAVENQGNSPSSGSYTVKKGDCLWKISKRLYKNPFQWPWCYRRNQPLIQNPDRIDIGWMLVVPEGVGSEEANQAIQFASDYKGPVLKTVHRRTASFGRTTMRQDAVKNSSTASAENPQASSSTSEKPAASNLPGQVSPNTGEQSSAPSRQGGGSAGPILAFIIVVILAGLGGWGWWRTHQSGKQAQEPYRLSRAAPEADEAKFPISPVTAPNQPVSPSTPPKIQEQPPPASSSGIPGQPVPPQPEESVSPPVGASPPVIPAPNPPEGQTPPPGEEKPKDETHRDVA